MARKKTTKKAYPPLVVLEVANDGGLYWIHGQGDITADFDWCAFHEDMEDEHRLEMALEILAYELEPTLKEHIEDMVEDCKNPMGLEDD